MITIPEATNAFRERGRERGKHGLVAVIVVVVMVVVVIILGVPVYDAGDGKWQVGD